MSEKDVCRAISIRLQNSSFLRAYRLIETLKVNPFYEYDPHCDCLFLQVLELMKMHSSALYLGYNKCGKLLLILTNWITNFYETIDVSKIYRRNNSNITICLSIHASEDGNYHSAIIPLTLLNLICFLGDVELFNLLIKLFGDKVINLINDS